jgi:hypothetical protein
MPDVFVAHEPFEASHPDSLAVYCSDGRFTNAVAELFKALDHDRLDEMTLPGGPALLHTASAGSITVETVRQSARFLIDAHHIQFVVLLAHEGCGYYKSRYGGDTQERITTIQHEDLGRASHWLKTAYPGISTAGYYVRPRDGRIAFEPVKI